MTAARVGRILQALGALVLAGAAVFWWHGERVFDRMRTSTCRLVIKQVESKLLVDQGPRAGRGDITLSRARLRYRDEGRLVFAHTVEGRKYTFREDFHAEALPLDDYEEGSTYPCRYDPEDPRHATIRTSYDPDSVQAALIGALGLMVFGVMIPRRWHRLTGGPAG